MTSHNNNGLFFPGTTTNKFPGNDWAFHGNTAFEPIYEGNFEAEIDAIAESTGDDSGYYSNDAESSEVIDYDFILYDDHPSPSNIEFETVSSAHQQHNFYTNDFTSNKSIHGSIYEETLNKSTTYAENGTSYGKQLKETRMSRTVYYPVHDHECKASHVYSSVESEASNQRPLGIWKSAYERHERIAYQLEKSTDPQSSKKRRSSSKK